VPAGDVVDLAWKFGTPVVTLFAGMVVWALTRHYRLTHLQSEHEKLQREKESLEGKLEETRRLSEEARQSAAERYDRLRADYQQAYAKFYQLKAAAIRVREERDSLRKLPPPAPPAEVINSNHSILAELEVQLATAQQELLETRARIEDATRTDGRIWLRPPAGPVTSFRSPEQRQSTIISVLNFKGGVGKTTITANLAATLAAKESRCLMVDLDYQRSLSMLLVGNKDRVILHRAGFTVQHFLSGESHSARDLLSRVKDLAPALPNCAVLTNSDRRSESPGADGLEETESRLMIEWLFDRNRPDPRYFLREALHERALGDAFRYVLLDCPPRLTTACVNALAASDYVLIPVVPDAVSIRAAENLLTTLRGLREVVCPHLRVLAVVPNMVKIHSGKPTSAHANALGTLRQPLRERWHEPVLVTECCIRYDAEFGLAAAELDAGKSLSLAISEEAVAGCFRKLAKELLQEMRHHESRRAAALPA
jgi:cellulose biosynthesis protein BcsQ/uncharacterized membrane-anchored protein YhcB (DUF1043 family)